MADINYPGMWRTSIIASSSMAIAFDIYQVLTAPSGWLAIVSIGCILIGLSKKLGILSVGWSYYLLIYVVPIVFCAVASSPHIEILELDRVDHLNSALATVGSALFPPAASALAVGLIWLTETAHRCVSEIC